MASSGRLSKEYLHHYLADVIFDLSYSQMLTQIQQFKTICGACLGICCLLHAYLQTDEMYLSFHSAHFT